MTTGQIIELGAFILTGAIWICLALSNVAGELRRVADILSRERLRADIKRDDKVEWL